MSKIIRAELKCQKCSTAFDFDLYRTLWVEYRDNRVRLMNDEINHATCPSCSYKFRVEFPFLATNVKRGIAIWYEPYHDKAVDDDAANYAKHMGPDSFYAKAPRVRGWQEFKAKLTEMEALASAKTPKVELSDEMRAKMSKFAQSLKEKQDRERKLLPWSEKWLGSKQKRLLLSFCIGTVGFFMFVLSIRYEYALSEKLVGAFREDALPLLIGSIICSACSFGLLSVVYRKAKLVKPWRELSYWIRLYVFGAGTWAIGGLLYYLVCDPFENGSIGAMFDYHGKEIIAKLLVPPVFVGILTLVYKKFVSDEGLK